MLKRVIKVCTAIAISLLICIQLFDTNVYAYWSNQYNYSSKAINLTSPSQNQITSVTLPDNSYAYSAGTDNGQVSYSQSGNQVTVYVSRGTSSTTTSQVWNPQKYSKTVTATAGPQSSQTFASTYSYNDGTYSGTLSQSGSAYVVSGNPPGSKIVNYDDYYYSPVTATWMGSYWNCVCDYGHNPYYDYGPDQDGYSGRLYLQSWEWLGGDTYNFPPNPVVGQQVHSLTDVHIVNHDSGTVARPDTRQWKMNYSGTVYAGGYDTVSNTVYSYDVTVYYYAITTVWIPDTTLPTGSATLSPSGITSGNVTINFTATDSGSGVKSVTLPNQSIINGSTATYIATDNGVYNFVVQDNDGNTNIIPITVSNIDRTITVTHPADISFSINPNSSTPFSASDISIVNQSCIKISVSVQGLSSTNGGTLVMNEVSPSKYSDWDKLTAIQTKSNIAIGVSVRETSTGDDTWSSISQTSPIYAANISSPVLMGVLNPSGAAGNLKLSACCGLAWDSTYTIKHNLVLVFQLT